MGPRQSALGDLAEQSRAAGAGHRGHGSSPARRPRSRAPASARATAPGRRPGAAGRATTNDLLDAEAARTGDVERAAELRAMAEVCRRVPEQWFKRLVLSGDVYPNIFEICPNFESTTIIASTPRVMRNTY